MRLEALPAGRGVFIDANIFIYHLAGQFPACRRLLERCEAGDVEGSTGIHVLLEVLHRLMMLEAVQKGLISPGNVARKLKEHPEVVRSLQDYQRLAASIPEMGVQIVPVDSQLVRASAAVRRRHGLLVNDSLSVAMMEAGGLQAIATADRDFQRVTGLEVFTPDG
ncbi:MAG: type II toxin-antitoxin system VapC family toxin [Chloroflexi bacterium]|nr:type II toxin-antitoxin system VapC family toxin [Chloroflexota bacterium]